MQSTSILFKTGFECGQNYGQLFHAEIAQRLDRAFLARKNFLWSFSAHIRPNNATFAARFEQTKTPACETQAPKRTHAKRKYAARKHTKGKRTERRQAKRRHTEHRHAKRRRAKRWHAKCKHARQPEDDNRNRPLASPARFPPFRQEYRAENKPRNSQRRKNTERHAEAVRIDAQIAARSERHDPDEHRGKQRA